MAEETLYMFPNAPGAALRCSTCDGTMMDGVRASQRHAARGIPGVRRLEIAAAG